MKPRTCAFALTLLLSLGSSLAAFETVVGSVRARREFVSSDLSRLRAELHPSEILLLDVDKPEFVDEISIDISLPARYADERNITVAALVYGSLEDVALNDREISTNGRRLHFEPLVDVDSTTIRIPVREEAPLREGGRHKVDDSPMPDDFPIAVTLLPVGKGLPSDLSDHTIAVTARPVSRGVGKLEIDLQTTSGESVAFEELEDPELEIDEKPHDPSDLFITPGFYSIRLRSENFREATATAAIDEGESSDVLLELSQDPATLFIDAPRGTQVFVNGSSVPRSVGTEIELEPGEHELSYQVGGRPVTRSVELEPGTSYTAKLDMNIDVLRSNGEASERDNEAEEQDTEAENGGEQ